MTQEPTPQPIVEGIDWPEPGYAQFWWSWDQMHFPRPSCPYTASIECGAMSRGSTKGIDALGLPGRYLIANYGGYNYGTIHLLDTDLAAWMPAAQARIVGELNGLLEKWRNVYLPEVMELNARLRDFDYGAASTEELAAQIRWSVEQRERQWEIHMRAVVPVMFAAGELGNQWEAAFGAARRAESLLLLQGFPNKTVEAAAELWKLSRQALALPEVARLLLESPLKRIMALLGTTEAGRAFKEKLDAYLREYGWRTGGFELADPAWIEEPGVALTALRDFMRQPNEMDPAKLEARSAAERDELLAKVGPEVDALEGGPFLRLLIALSQQYLPLQEDHNFYIDQMNTVLMRWPAKEAGRRLAAADVIALPEDVFYLTVDEVIEAMRAPAARDWAELVAERRAVRARQAEAQPPQNLGTPLPPELLADPAFRGITGFFGEPMVQDETSNVLRGTAASRGTISGRACVVRSLEEADRLQPGDILVCEMTMPAWTPLFAVAAGVVTDTGGALSHSAIVAREYRVPCVVGTTTGTRRIRDGQRITVDGTAGTVTIEPE